MPSGLLGQSPNGKCIDVEAFLDSITTPAIARIVDLGCLVSIGTTRDGGALSLSITHDGDYDREYFRTVDDALEWLRAAEVVLRGRGLTSKSKAAPVDQKPVRRRSAIR